MSFRLQNYSEPGFWLFCGFFLGCGEVDVSVLHHSALAVELGRKSRSCVVLLCDSLILLSQTNLLCQC